MQVLELNDGFNVVVVFWLGVIPIRVGGFRCSRNRGLSWLILLWFLLFIGEGLLLENAEGVVVDIVAALLLSKEKGLDELAPFLAIGERDLANNIDDDTPADRGLGIDTVNEYLAVLIFEFRDTFANFLGTASVHSYRERVSDYYGLAGTDARLLALDTMKERAVFGIKAVQFLRCTAHVGVILRNEGPGNFGCCKGGQNEHNM